MEIHSCRHYLGRILVLLDRFFFNFFLSASWKCHFIHFLADIVSEVKRQHVVFVFILFRVHEVSQTCEVLFFVRIGKFQLYTDMYFLSLSLSLSFTENLVTCILDLLILSHMSLTLFSFQLFFLCFTLNNCYRCYFPQIYLFFLLQCLYFS